MNYSDEQLKDGDNGEVKPQDGVGFDYVTMPKITPAPSPRPAVRPDEPSEPSSDRSLADELITVIVKSLFVTLSLIAMLACILAVALPLTSMRVFNKLGMSERAVDFGERYISRELRSYTDADGRTAAYVDEYDNYPVLSLTPELTNDDFVEALYVCNRLSDKLLTQSLLAGDAARAEYYARRLQKYTGMYLSLNGLSALSIKTDADNIAGMPSAALRPVVYSYEHDMRVKNYKARAVLGNTDRMAYNNRRYTDGITVSLNEFSNTVYGTSSDTDEGKVRLLDDYIDYIDQLGAYLDVEFIKLGVETELTKQFTVDIGDREIDVPVLSETYIKSEYAEILDGDEFSLFLIPLKDVTESNKGFTRLYSQLSCFTRYAQWAVDTVPVADDGKLHQLYWLKVLSSVSQKLWYMEMLMYYSSTTLGLNGESVIASYNTCQRYTLVKYDNPAMSGVVDYQISEVYRLKLQDYVNGVQG